ncbi:MAG TPA: gamma-glutamyl-phosphate reductase, partial [Thermopetrobacter sp.]|nr:gamma-glutamyl-phosphate reductase [Thermopetrobacter sp.]
MTDVKPMMAEVGRRARRAADALAGASTEAKNAALKAMAAAIRAREAEILEANA